MTSSANARTRFALLTIAAVAAGWMAFGNRFLSGAAHALEQGRLQSDAQSLAELERDMPEVAALSRAFKLVARTARPGVVHIRVAGGSLDGEEDQQQRRQLREQLEGVVPPDQIDRMLRRMQPPGSGSGILMDAEGLILTNHHVIEGRDEIEVMLWDDREYAARVVGMDPKTDLAVLKIDAPDLHPLTFGDSSAVEVGDWVLAVGSPFGLTQTITHGIVSAIGRTRIPGVDILYQDFIQTDAAINPGNSGGPLLNLRGQVVGVNTAIATRGDGVNAGVAFAIPSAKALRIARELKDKGTVQRGWIGISYTQIRSADVDLFGLSGPSGVLVERVITGSPADRDGLKVEDVVVEVNGTQIEGTERLRTLVADMRPDEVLNVRLFRDGRERRLSVRLGLQPEDVQRMFRAPGTDARELPRLGVYGKTLRTGMLRGVDDKTRGVIVWDNTNSETGQRIPEGSVITACNGLPVSSVSDLNRALGEVPDGQSLTLTVMEVRGGQSRTLMIEP